MERNQNVEPHISEQPKLSGFNPVKYIVLFLKAYYRAMDKISDIIGRLKIAVYKMLWQAVEHSAKSQVKAILEENNIIIENSKEVKSNYVPTIRRENGSYYKIVQNKYDRLKGRIGTERDRLECRRKVTHKEE